MSGETHYKPSWVAKFPKLTVAESTRLGGVSSAPLNSLNLVSHPADSADNVLRNREIFCHSIGWEPARLATLFQVHGAHILPVYKPGTKTGFDAMVTDEKNVLLAVTIADCTPVLLYDPVAGVLGAAHAGWRGTVAAIAAKTVLSMQRIYGSHPSNCWAYIGTCIGTNDFEVDADVADHFGPAHKRWDTEHKKYLVDLKKANRDQLLNLGVPSEQIEVSPYSTVRNNNRYFSHRAERGLTGRMLAVIGKK